MLAFNEPTEPKTSPGHSDYIDIQIITFLNDSLMQPQNNEIRLSQITPISETSK